jgi:hypothetical protein
MSPCREWLREDEVNHAMAGQRHVRQASLVCVCCDCQGRMPLWSGIEKALDRLEHPLGRIFLEEVTGLC